MFGETESICSNQPSQLAMHHCARGLRKMSARTNLPVEIIKAFENMLQRGQTKDL
jgi:hypothetical protein